MVDWIAHKSLSKGKNIKYLGLGYCPECCRYETKTVIIGETGLFFKKPITKEIRVTLKEVPVGEFKGNTYCLNCGHILGIGIKNIKK